jgi:dihydroxy-acid dehydratase
VAAIGQPGRLPKDIMTPAAFRNAQVVLQAIGGSTNGLVHLAAIAGRLGIKLDGGAFDRLGADVPVLIDLKPTGDHYMEHFHWSGGMPKLMKELGPLLDTTARTITGGTLADAVAAAEDVPNQTVIRSKDNPIFPTGGMAVLGGNLAPGSAVIKFGAATPGLLQHTGRAMVFDGVDDMARRIDDPALDVKPEDVLVLRYAGPKGAPGMPEAGYLPIPRKLARAGVKDMVRISDARMSGTAFGTIVLHIVPEACLGGPLALVQTGDMIKLDVAGRRIDLLVDDAELTRRREAWTPPPAPPGADRGYLKLYLDSVLQADEGCDFSFLVPQSNLSS